MRYEGEVLCDCVLSVLRLRQWATLPAYEGMGKAGGLNKGGELKTADWINRNVFRGVSHLLPTLFASVLFVWLVVGGTS